MQFTLEGDDRLQLPDLFIDLFLLGGHTGCPQGLLLALPVGILADSVGTIWDARGQTCVCTSQMPIICAILQFKDLFYLEVDPQALGPALLSSACWAGCFIARIWDHQISSSEVSTVAHSNAVLEFQWVGSTT